MKVYAAGKISRDDWRARLIGYRINQYAEWEAGVFLMIENGVLGQHSYVGPYYRNGLHTGSHGDNRHGVGTGVRLDRVDQHGTLTDALEGVDAIPVIPEGYERGWSEGPNQRDTMRMCLEGIEGCDILYAWLDDVTAYGTFAEIGYARARKKRILIASPQVLPDLWFVYTMAERVILRDDPITALRDLLALVQPDKYQEYLQSPEWDKKHRAKLKEADFRCQLCNADDKPIHVHHRTYERKYNERSSDLIALCADCHAKFHGKVTTQ